ncbi:SNAP25 homologous protein SNAP33-like [Syzygium oleosum]|uniref:SNAP25 homologous protein SNAP33-like n=1 Tax=Syzygium oleosum TaxID=219896 RepID=UPI0011D2AB8C|nr:SNAP25 homologous protein SNAP33-like [Syzygium oleosum]
MYSSKRSPVKVAKHNPAESGYADSSRSNPFDSDDEFDKKKMPNSSKGRASEHDLTQNSRNDLFDGYEEKGTSSSSHSNALDSAARSKYRNDFRDSGGLQNQSVQELENYAVYKAEETTKSVNNCRKIAEDIREDATKTLVTLHQQGEQITRTHMAAADIDHDLSRGEKLLGNLGGMFSKTWKPKKTRPISGPVITREDVQRKGSHLEQREKLGLTNAPKLQSKSRTPPPEPTNALEKVEVEKAKQDDALSDLSDILGELKDMAVDMGSEIERQNKSLDHFYNDADELDYRVKQATQRGRRLLGK